MSLLGKGDNAPEFALLDQSERRVSLKEFLGKKVLIYFYPKADTPGCTTQSCALRDALSDLAGKGVAVVGISPDAPPAQGKFDAKYGLGFPLLADQEHAVAEAYGVWREKSMYGKTYMGIVRSAFLVDERGKLAAVWYKVSPKATVPNVLSALDDAS